MRYLVTFWHRFLRRLNSRNPRYSAKFVRRFQELCPTAPQIAGHLLTGAGGGDSSGGEDEDEAKIASTDGPL